MSGVLSRWLGGVEALPEIGERLIRVQIENRPATDNSDPSARRAKSGRPVPL
jgi:hypothetical protein